MRILGLYHSVEGGNGVVAMIRSRRRRFRPILYDVDGGSCGRGANLIPSPSIFRSGSGSDGILNVDVE